MTTEHEDAPGTVEDAGSGSGSQSESESNGDTELDTELDSDEGADAFETTQEAEGNARDEGGERDDLDHITVDTPD